MELSHLTIHLTAVCAAGWFTNDHGTPPEIELLPHFMDPEDTIPCSQNPAICFCPEPDKFLPLPHHQPTLLEEC